ncbi:hypothetical protein D3C71_1185840 [compost metagenome]
MRRGHAPRHQRGAIGHADRGRDIEAVGGPPLVGQGIQRRGLQQGVAVTTHVIRALLIRDEEQKVGLQVGLRVGLHIGLHRVSLPRAHIGLAVLMRPLWVAVWAPASLWPLMSDSFPGSLALCFAAHTCIHQIRWGGQRMPRLQAIPNLNK